MSSVNINENINKICRGCLSDQDVMTDVLLDEGRPTILEMFENCTSIQIEEDDGCPTQICAGCVVQLKELYRFRQMCLRNDIALKANSYQIVNNNAGGEDIIIDENPDDINEKIMTVIYKECDTVKESYDCKACLSQTFKTVEDLNRHEFDWHNIVETKYSDCEQDLTNDSCSEFKKSTSVKKKYKCNHCSKEYTSSNNLQIHQYSHGGIKPYVCKECGKSFAKLNALQSHESLHTGSLSYLCTECGKRFSTKTGVQRHKIAHSGERPYKCKICPRRFIATGDLNVHMRCHTGEKPYLCPTCGKAFSRISHMNTHARIHTGEKPFKCSHCDKAFTQSGDLRSHIRTHTGEKPYECTVCCKRFVQSSGLRSHLRIHTGEKTHVCNVCHKAFSQGSSLVRHMRCHNY